MIKLIKDRNNNDKKFLLHHYVQEHLVDHIVNDLNYRFNDLDLEVEECFSNFVYGHGYEYIKIGNMFISSPDYYDLFYSKFRELEIRDNLYYKLKCGICSSCYCFDQDEYNSIVNTVNLL